MTTIDILDKINEHETYYGEVVQIENDKKRCRVRVRVVTVFDEIPDQYIPWAIPYNMDGQTHDFPFIGEVVNVKFDKNDIYNPMWYRRHQKDYVSNISQENYKDSTIIMEKDLSKFDMDGYMSVYYCKEKGLILELKRNENVSNVIISHDNTISLNNGDTKQSLHISDSNISIGSLKRSQQPAVVGDDNQKAFEMINDSLKDIMAKHNQLCDMLSKSASKSPYTKHLTVPLRNLGKDTKKLTDDHHKENDNFFPETKSTVVTIDKTNENE